MIKTDHAAKVDILDRESLAEYITNSISHTAKHETNGFVVGITGKWGSGKSTLLGFVREKLKEKFAENEACFLEFNPWALSEATDLRKAFLKQFTYGIAPKAHRKNWWKKPIKAIIELLKNFTVGIEKVSEVSVDLNSLLSKYLDTDNTTYFKKLIDDNLEKSNRKIFVFIDDIDRLAPAQVFALFQLLKLTGNFKNTYYILAFDREAVEISIESQFSNYGQKFLDKIIQVDFGMPEITEEKIEQLFFDQLEELIKGIEIPYNRSELSGIWLHRGLKEHFRTIRDINRFINSLQFSLPPIAHEIHLCDFLVLETLRLYNYPVYVYIFNEGGWSVKNYSGKHNFKFQTEAEERITKPLLDYLFEPYTKNNNNAKRLRDPKYFDRYFTLRIAQKDVSEKELRMFFENPNTEAVLTDTLNFGRLRNLLIRLNDLQILNHYSIWDITLIEKTYTYFQNNYNKLREYENAFIDAIINLLSVREKDQYKYFSRFLQFLIQQKHMYSGAKIHFLHFMCLDKKDNTGFSSHSYAFRDFYRKKLAEIEKEYTEYMTKWKNYVLSHELTEPDNPSTLYFFYDYATYFEEDYLNDLPEYLKIDSYVLFFLRSILIANTEDDEPFRINGDTMNHFLPGVQLNNFAHALGKIDEKKLTDNQVKWREYFLLFAYEHLSKKGLLTYKNPNDVTD